jgi:hypothetical protein
MRFRAVATAHELTQWSTFAEIVTRKNASNMIFVEAAVVHSVGFVHNLAATASSERCATDQAHSEATN